MRRCHQRSLIGAKENINQIAIITPPINMVFNKNYPSVLRILVRKLSSTIVVGLKSDSYGFSAKTCRKVPTSQVCTLDRDTLVHLTLASLLLKRET